MDKKKPKIHFKKNIFLIIFILSPFILINGQDPTTSHYFLSNSFFNPAFSGLNDYVDLTANYRNQWPGLGNAFVNYKAGLDGYTIKKSGLGAIMSRDVTGSGTYNNTGLDIFYTYTIKPSPFSNMAFGLQSSLYQSSLNDPGIIDLPSWANDYSETTGLNESFFYPDFSVGFAYSTRKIKAGISTFHLLEPQKIQNDPLSISKRKYSFDFIYKTPLTSRFSKDEKSISTMIHTDYQDKIVNLFYGLSYNSGIFEPGIWIRHNINVNKSASIILSSKINYLNLFIVYTFDALLTNSYLSFNNFGVHEVTLGYHFKYKGRRKIKEGTINCPYY